MARHVITAYNETGRHYHDFGHIRKMLSVLEQFVDQADNPLAIRLAIIFHDYRQGPNHERRSAEALVTLLEPFSPILGRGLINEAAELILDTKHPGLPKTNDGRLIYDLDLQGFSHSFERCHASSLAIRLECASVSDETFYVSQLAFFDRLMSAGPIYQHPAFAIFEDKARANIKKLIKILPILSILP